MGRFSMSVQKGPETHIVDTSCQEFEIMDTSDTKGVLQWRIIQWLLTPYIALFDHIIVAKI